MAFYSALVCAGAQETVTVGRPAAILLTRPDSDGDVWYSLRIPVSNRTAGFVSAMLELQAVDKDGFEIDSAPLCDTLRPSQTQILSRKAFMSYAQFRSIASWRVKDSSYRVAPEPTVVVSDIIARVQTRPDRAGDVWYAVKANVANYGDRPIRGVILQAVDKDGFEIDAIPLTGNVPPGRQTSLSQRTFMRHADFVRIASWQHVDR